MKIALVSPVEETVPPRKYGGTELVISNLAEGLVAAGHEVYLLASGDSATSGNLVPIVPQAIRTMPIAQDDKTRETLKIMAMGTIMKKLGELNVDIIHNHTWRLVPFLENLTTASCTTLHDPLTLTYKYPLFETFRQHPYISISNSQRKPLPNLNYAATIYNGIDLEKFTFQPTSGKYLVFLGRITPDKGPKIAIEAAKKAGMPLLMAAKVDAVDKHYFEQEIKPLIDGVQIQFLGEVGPEEKNTLLSGAYALLAPVQWEEPFGLFMIEAMACGTPVIAMNRGSIPEVILDQKTGFIVNTPEEMVKKIKDISIIDRLVCRQHVEKNFSLATMTNNYIAAYQRIIAEN